MTSDYMKYEEGVLTDLADLLVQFKKDLGAESDNFHSAAKKLEVAWAGNTGLDAFQRSVQKWDTSFGAEGDSSTGTALGMIQALSDAVRTALANAQAADRGVQNSFSQYE
ncbi:WXG100 family type VII secretion target [Nocardia sp. alder85J]|uniref:WXG100 family type VII secretion target n=1 Tax=Nocardia sp. alder85J TaxID=2862949 RepID=UPI001CD4116E|nr:hypothetical protein [Nocardia sp. alder85J]MCX4093084.1 hypothetical protein [Nocardia sp. alder85J]